MAAGSSPRWMWIAVILLALCIAGYIWTLGIVGQLYVMAVSVSSFEQG
jgi:hypothetical protein